MKSINMFSYLGERSHPNGRLVKTNDLSRNKPDNLHENKIKYINEGINAIRGKCAFKTAKATSSKEKRKEKGERQ